MKKTMIALFALSALTACSNDETLDVVSSQPITFNDAFVDNSTRAALDGSYTKDEINAFQVYGAISNGTGTTLEAANIFNGTEVTKTDGLWGYTNTQYWIPGNTYNFTAIVDGNVKVDDETVTAVETDAATGMPTSIKLNDVSKQKDILYATVEQITDVTEGYNTEVAFTFNHLLAKAKFTVKNEIANTAYAYKVTSIKIANAIKSAKYSVSTSTWTADTPAEGEAISCEITFGNIVDNATPEGADASLVASSDKVGKESNYERLLIPGTYSGLEIVIDTELFIKDNIKDAQGKDVYKSFQTRKDVNFTPTEDVTLQAGHAYNFVITLGAPGNPIKFTVQALEAWDTDHDNDNKNDDETPLTEQTTQQ